MSLLKFVSNLILPTYTLYVKLRKNQIDVRCLENKNELSRVSKVDFSNDRLMISDTEIAELLLNSVVNDLLDNENKILRRPIHIILQVFDEKIKEITPSEKRIYQDFAFFGGFESKLYTLIEHQNLLSDEEVINLILNK